MEKKKNILEGGRLILRSEQVPGNGFHPQGLLFFLPSWCNKKSDPVRYVQCDSFKLLVSNAGCQMKEN